MTEQLEAPARLRTPRWGFGDVVVTLLAALVIGNVLALLLLPPTTPDHPVTGHAWQTLLVLVGPWVALAGWPLFATRTRGNGPVRDLALRTTWRSAAIGVLFGVAGLVSALVVLSIQQSLTHEQPSARAADVAHIFVSTSPVVLALFALATAFGAPVVEELAFRGLTYGAFVNRGVAPVWSVLGHHGAVRAVPLRAAAAARARRARRVDRRRPRRHRQHHGEHGRAHGDQRAGRDRDPAGALAGRYPGGRNPRGRRRSAGAAPPAAR